MNSIIGKYKTAKIFSMVNGDRGIFPIEDVIEDRKKNGGDTRDLDMIAATLTEFTEDGKIREWMKLPASVTEQMLKAAIEAGQVEGGADGYAYTTKSEWKEENGKLFYDTKIESEVLGEKQSSWVELTEEDGMLVYNAGMSRLEKI